MKILFVKRVCAGVRSLTMGENEKKWTILKHVCTIGFSPNKYCRDKTTFNDTTLSLQPAELQPETNEYCESSLNTKSHWPH